MEIKEALSASGLLVVGRKTVKSLGFFPLFFCFKKSISDLSFLSYLRDNPFMPQASSCLQNIYKGIAV